MGFEELSKSELVQLVRDLDRLITEVHIAYIENDFQKLSDLVNYAAGRLEGEFKALDEHYQPLSLADKARLEETWQRTVQEAKTRGIPMQPNAASMTPKEKSAAIRAHLKQVFPGAVFSVTTESRGTAYGHTKVRWNADHYPLNWDAVRAALEQFDQVWCGPTRDK